MGRLFLVGFNLVELKYYPFQISLGKCSGICDSDNDLSKKIGAPNKTKDVHANVFFMITNRNESKTLVKHIPLDGKCKFNCTICNSLQKWNNDKFRCVCKKCRMCKKDYRWNPSKCICKNGKYLQTIVDDSKTVCDEIIYVVDIVPANVTSTVLIIF